MSRPGRRHWSTLGSPDPIGMVYLTMFDRMCQELHIEGFEQQKESTELRRWVEVNKRHYYVPEKLLKAWGISLYIDVD
jgi:hypothetical protein